jgi:predicted GNAT superfamily acetyltransferase
MAMLFTVKQIGDDPETRANIVCLNNASARETSPLDADKLAWMIAEARVATLVDPGAAFLLAFDQSANYDSWNLMWFRQRYETFLYIDRVVVAEAYRRLGLGRLLYEDCFLRAAHLGHHRIGCEVNVRPPNPVSDAFHASLGFTEVGKRTTADGTKSVRYLLRDL